MAENLHGPGCVLDALVVSTKGDGFFFEMPTSTLRFTSQEDHDISSVQTVDAHEQSNARRVAASREMHTPSGTFQ